MTHTTDLTAGSLDLFLAYAMDAPDWGGTPLVGGNVGAKPADKGHLTDLKKKGLVTTYMDEGNAWLSFTDEGKALAAEHGVEL